jgi:hypothetical protein
MAETQAVVALVSSVVIAYYVVSRWRALASFLVFIVLAVFVFGVFMLVQTFNGEPPTQGDQVVKTETTSHPR